MSYTSEFSGDTNANLDPVELPVSTPFPVPDGTTMHRNGDRQSFDAEQVQDQFGLMRAEWKNGREIIELEFSGGVTVQVENKEELSAGAINRIGWNAKEYLLCRDALHLAVEAERLSDTRQSNIGLTKVSTDEGDVTMGQLMTDAARILRPMLAGMTSSGIHDIARLLGALDGDRAISISKDRDTIVVYDEFLRLHRMVLSPQNPKPDTLPNPFAPQPRVNVVRAQDQLSQLTIQSIRSTMRREGVERPLLVRIGSGEVQIDDDNQLLVLARFLKIKGVGYEEVTEHQILEGIDPDQAREALKALVDAGVLLERRYSNNTRDYQFLGHESPAKDALLGSDRYPRPDNI